ncbi:hydroxypyruvate isomerase family protein [Pararhodobacter oceanensis]|uniref:hydroxypyruvate isomerase family protein n=1 Tax=Pararhodobacter oceanensis TaxID=2172121 RepID=UPI003A8F257A
MAQGLQFSANLGFLWTDRPLVARIHAAKAAGFAAVECHWPFDTPASVVKRALTEADLPMLALNTPPGDLASGDFGNCALKGREDEAKAAICEAITYAAEVGARAVHVMAGKGGEIDVFIEALEFACELAAPLGLNILIEPLNPYDVPDYLLSTTGQAKALIAALNRPNLKLMFDCYHVARTEGAVLERFTSLQPLIGHIQIAAVPDRGAPDHGDIAYSTLLPAFSRLGWQHPIGAEYRPEGATEASLGWMRDFKS